MTNQLHLPAPRNGYTEQEDAVVEMIRAYMTEAKSKRATGRLTFEIDYQEGGITAKWAGMRIKAK